mmetsp:Transcript_19731/g.29197  ORF Transcript_19731/g.29197 Transcript_19731/m.29197 type:complete len:94 (+) Transcript_19731:15-296(+)
MTLEFSVMILCLCARNELIIASSCSPGNVVFTLEFYIADCPAARTPSTERFLHYNYYCSSLAEIRENKMVQAKEMAALKEIRRWGGTNPNTIH